MIKNNKFKICILGAGFGGISTLANLKELSKQKDVEITLISNKNYFLFTPLLHEVATGEVRPYNVIYPIEKLKLNLFNFKFIEDLVINIDFDKKFVKTSNSDVYYDYLVIGLGSVTNFYNIESVKKNA